MATTTLRKLSKELPQSETDWRHISARAHRSIGGPGSEAAARTHEGFIRDIRKGKVTGSSRRLLDCPRCLQDDDRRFLLLDIGGDLMCGACHWPADPPTTAVPDPGDG